MLDHGLPAGLTGGGGISLLHVAAQHGRALVVKQLLIAGAAPNCKDAEGRTPADYAKAHEEVQAVLADAIANGPPLETVATVFDVQEQVYCRDKTNNWWPAVVTG